MKYINLLLFLIVRLSADDFNFQHVFHQINDTKSRIKILEKQSNGEKFALFIFNNTYLLVGLDKKGSEYYSNEYKTEIHDPNYHDLDNLIKKLNTTKLSKEDLITLHSVRDGMIIVVSTGKTLKYFSDPIILYSESLHKNLSSNLKIQTELYIKYCFKYAQFNTFFLEYFKLSLGENAGIHIKKNKFDDLSAYIKENIGAIDDMSK